jgi:peptidoglycan/xylan/chitin deacetylase (PgdA/CDA1 family)
VLADLKKKIIRTGMETLYFSGAHRLLSRWYGGVGLILTLHHVRPASPQPFQPNRLLEISPDFLEQVALQLRRSNVDIVSLDEMHRRLVEGDFERRFVTVTFDDGYKDTLQYAYPVLKRHEIPFAIYIPTSFPEGSGELWWLALESVISRNESVELVFQGQNRRFDCRTPQEKSAVFATLYWWLRSFQSEDELRSVVRELCGRHHVDITALCDELCMGWDEIATLAADPLVTIGAHTVNHPMLAKVSEEAVRSELKMSRSAIEARLGIRPHHFAYPVGDATSAGSREFRIAAELNFRTAVTTRPGVLFPEHAQHLTALPRISVNGEFQQLRYFNVLTSGAATAMWNGFRRVNAA